MKEVVYGNLEGNHTKEVPVIKEIWAEYDKKEEDQSNLKLCILYELGHGVVLELWWLWWKKKD